MSEKFYRVTGNFPSGSCEFIKTGEPLVHVADMVSRGALLVAVALIEIIEPNIWRDNR